MTIHTPEHRRQAESYQSVQNRLWNSKPKPKIAPPNKPTKYVPYMAPRIPLWEREQITFNAHILAFRQWQADQYERTTAKGYIISRCEDFGVSYLIMIGPSRHRPVTSLRQILYFEVHEKFGRSFPQIGRLFGGRDHTSCLHGYRKIKNMAVEERDQLIRKSLNDLSPLKAKQMGVGE